MPAPMPPVPDGWSLTSLMMHNEADITPNDPAPFAATILVQQRIDVAPGTPITDVLAGDIIALEGQLPGFKIRTSGVDEPSKLRHLDADYFGEGQELRQLMLYVPQGDRLFIVTLTGKRAGFDKLRPQTFTVAKALGAA